MTTQEIIAVLSESSSNFPHIALTEALQRKEEMIPFLLASLDKVCDNADKLIEEKSSYDLHFYAIYLLAQFREKKAFPKLIRLLKKDEKTLDYFLGDALTSGYDRCLFSTYDGNLDMLKELIEDENAYEFARGVALDTYGFIARDNRISREEIIKYFRYLIHERLTKNSSRLPTLVSSCILDEHLFELIPDVKSLYNRELIDYSFHGGYDEFIDHIFNYSRGTEDIYINDTIKELQHWAKYDEKTKKEDKPLLKPLPKPIQPPMLADNKKKTGRNDPCPCGSGKKYKKCCLSSGMLFDSKKKSEEDEPAGSTENIFDFMRGLYDDTEPYDLMKNYPSRKQPSADGTRSITEFYSNKAIDIDIPVYKAICHRQIPIFIKRNTRKDNLERIDFLLKAFTMFEQTCKEENIETFAAFDSKYMVHYESGHWVSVLSGLLNKYADVIPAQALAAREAVDTALARMGPFFIPPKVTPIFSGLTSYLDSEDEY